MGTWGIARDMAKLNEENLSKLSRKGIYKKWIMHGSYSKKKVYQFKEAPPDLLRSIRERKAAENRSLRNKKIVLASSIVMVLLSLFLYLLP